VRDKVKKFVKYTFFILYTNALFAALMYFSFTWLAKYSLLYAYLGNLLLIVIGLILDNLTLKMYQSKKFITMLRESDDPEKEYRSIERIHFDVFVSYKTALYVFYIIIMIAAQVVEFYPTLLGENLVNLISANQYSILLLIALDQITVQFSKDRKKVKEVSAQLKADMAESQE